MNTNQAAYWIALGVLALGLNSEYQHGRFVTLHRAAERAAAVLCQVSTCAGQTLAAAIGNTGHRAIPPDNFFTAADRAEAARAPGEMLGDRGRARAEIIREHVRNEIRAQAELRRAEFEQIRWRTRSELRLAGAGNAGVAVACPKTGMRIVVSDTMQAGDDTSDVEVVGTFQ